MSANHSIARPYARAIFELAKAQSEFGVWSEQLKLLAAIATDTDLVRAAGHPKISQAQLQELIIGAAGSDITPAATNLVKILIRNGRFLIAPQVAYAYEQLRAEAEQVVSASLTTAVYMDENLRAHFTDALNKKLGRKVELEFNVDEDLIGGAVLRTGDSVLDASTRSALDKLQTAIGA